VPGPFLRDDPPELQAALRPLLTAYLNNTELVRSLAHLHHMPCRRASTQTLVSQTAHCIIDFAITVSCPCVPGIMSC